LILLCRALSRPVYLSLFHAPATIEIYTLSLHDALPISNPLWNRRMAVSRCSGLVGVPPPDVPASVRAHCLAGGTGSWRRAAALRSEEHTSELQSRFDLVCRLLLEKKKKKSKSTNKRIRE